MKIILSITAFMLALSVCLASPLWQWMNSNAASSGGGGKALVFHGITKASTLSGQNTVGSTIIVIHAVSNASPPGAPTDSQSDAYVAVNWSTNLAQTLYDYTYVCYGPTTGSSVTFNNNSGGGQLIEVSGWSGTQSTSSALDGANSNNVPVNFNNSTQCGALTPTTTSDLFLASVEMGGSSITFTNTYSLLDTNYSFPYFGIAYQISTSNNAANPVAVLSGSQWLIGSHTDFK